MCPRQSRQQQQLVSAQLHAHKHLQMFIPSVSYIVKCLWVACGYLTTRSDNDIIIPINVGPRT